ncbi:DNA-binding protein WhiA [Candidatus Mycobacterium methanotrophicum]|uniref:DNA-binding protein WhiA n=2 Tax=Candidatus Mycobacterium methanotrophicum TaxID=2943498 RepID=A0ABY4QLJ9_9MYCO|nr:DNA-binding protein WhiA [Candidatus Mycobacterium methanotrophicum]UQX10731.1 DNA-binding protein WhiA [Candidatus Mycobacterium methanotrophicum]
MGANTSWDIGGAAVGELCRLTVMPASARRAQVATLLRCAGARVRVVAGRSVLSAELDDERTAARLRADLAAGYGCQAAIRTRPRPPRHVVGVSGDGESLARRAGLLDAHGRLVRGLPAQLVGGQIAAEAVWRGAFLACGSLDERAIRLDCPTPEAALALVGAARRLGVRARARDAGGVDRVTVRGREHIALLLARIGAGETVRALQQRWAVRGARPRQPGEFAGANQARATQAAADTAARARRALEILGDGAPAQLVQAARLRIEHQQVPLGQLGRLADPPLSKDTISGQLRRLLALADRAAAAAGIPDTQSQVAAAEPSACRNAS